LIHALIHKDRTIIERTV